MDKVRFGIVGCGNMGSSHAKNILEGKVANGVLTALCDINPVKLDALRERCGEEVKFFSNAEEMFASGECDVVMICTPHYIHPTLAISALDHDLNCIVDVASCEDIINASVICTEGTIFGCRSR